MHCPVCQKEHPGPAPSCSQCGNSLSSPAPSQALQPTKNKGKPRPSRRRGLAEETDSPFSDRGEGNNRTAALAYRLSVWGILPGVGLVLGPVALVMACWARWRARRDPEFKARNLVTAALGLGLALTLTQWVGLVLMIRGW